MPGGVVGHDPVTGSSPVRTGLSQHQAQSDLFFQVRHISLGISSAISSVLGGALRGVLPPCRMRYPVCRTLSSGNVSID